MPRYMCDHTPWSNVGTERKPRIRHCYCIVSTYEVQVGLPDITRGINKEITASSEMKRKWRPHEANCREECSHLTRSGEFSIFSFDSSMAKHQYIKVCSLNEQTSWYEGYRYAIMKDYHNCSRTLTKSVTVKCVEVRICCLCYMVFLC